MGYSPVFFYPRPTPSRWNNQVECVKATKALISNHGYCFESAVGKTTKTLLGLLFHLAPEAAAEMVAGEISGMSEDCVVVGNIRSMESGADKPSIRQQLFHLKLERALDDIEFANCQISYLMNSQREHTWPFRTSKFGSAREHDSKVCRQSNQPRDPVAFAELSDHRQNNTRSGILQETVHHTLDLSRSILTTTQNVDHAAYKLDEAPSSSNSLLSSRVRSRHAATTSTAVSQASHSRIDTQSRNPVPTELHEVGSVSGLWASLEDLTISSHQVDRTSIRKPRYHGSHPKSNATSPLLKSDSKGKTPVQQPSESTGFKHDKRPIEPTGPFPDIHSRKTLEQSGRSRAIACERSPIESSSKESERSLSDPQSSRNPINLPHAILDARSLLENEEFHHEAINLDVAQSLRVFDARIPNAFGVQWEYTRLTLDCQVEPNGQSTSVANVASIQQEDLSSCSPHLDIVWFSRALLGSPVAEKVWKELDMEFLSDIEGEERALGFGKSAHFKNINTSVGNIRSLEENLIGWYGGKVKFSGVILSTDKKKTEFTIKLNPPKIDRSCLFKRKFGSTSFLELSVEEGLTNSNESMKRLFYFVKKPFTLLGQTWTIFDHDDSVFHYFSPGPSDGFQLGDKHPPAARNLRRKFHPELQDLDSFLRWYCPLDMNEHLTVAKLASRFKLGRSPTVPALEFESSDILRGDDRYGVDDIVANEAFDKDATEACMTDGSGWMNKAAFELIRKVFHETRLTTTVQARICGCKGTWTLGPRNWPPHDDERPRVMLRKSQLKIRYAHDLDPCNRILNVVTLSRATCPSHLSPQIIEKLSDRGVPYAVFKQLMERVLQGTFDELSDWSCHPGETRCHLKRRLYKTYEKLGVMIARRRWELGDQAKVFLGGLDSHSQSGLSNTTSDFTSSEPDYNSLSASSNPIQVDPSSGQPLAQTEKILALLRSGFLPLECPYLANKMISEIKLQLKDQIKKFRIPCPSSAVTMIVPDGEEVLKENEVAFYFSEPPIDESGMSIDFIQGEVLLLRHPCLLPTDIRKVTAVHHPALTRYKDVIILPTVGAQSLASILGGGDLDGDRAVIIWDPAIVDAFTNADLSHCRCPFDKSKHFTQETIKVSEFLACSKSLDNAKRVELFQTMMLRSILIRSSHAKFSMWHVKSCYANGSEHPKSIELAHFVMLLLDSAKSGLKLSPQTLRDFSRWNQRQMPTYHQWMKTDEKNPIFLSEEINSKYLQRNSSLPTHPLDALREDCLRVQKQLLQCFESPSIKLTKNSISSRHESVQDMVMLIQHEPDDHLSSPWNDFCNEFAQDEEIQSDCNAIKNHVNSVRVQYQRLMGRYGALKNVCFMDKMSTSEIPNSTSFLNISRNFHQGLKIEDMKSTPFKSGLISQQKFSRLKASCAYCCGVKVDGYYTEAKFAWEVAFDDLCALKLEGLGRRFVCVDEALFPALRIDPKMAS